MCPAFVERNANVYGLQISPILIVYDTKNITIAKSLMHTIGALSVLLFLEEGAEDLVLGAL